MTTTEDYICGICQDTLSGDQCEVRLSCSHRFHFQCLQQAYQWSSRCPMCRNLTVPNFFGIYPSYISLPATPSLIRQLAYIAEDNFEEDDNEIIDLTSDTESTSPIELDTITPAPSPERNQRGSSR